MTDIKLSKRLAAIAELIPEGCGVADIGTDHGFIPVWLCKRGKNAPIFAADISPEPLRHAAQAAQEHGVTDKITLVLCDGLAAFDGSEAAAIVIAGMGGETIISILQNARWTKNHGKTLILQPMTKSALLRQWLFENGYLITGETLVDDGKLYELFTAVGGQERPYTEAELYTGHTALISESALYPRRLEELLAKTRRAIEGLSLSSAEDKERRLEELSRLLRELTELKTKAGRIK